MSEKKVCKKILFPISLWQQIEVFTSQNFIEFPQESLRLLISRGLRVHDKYTSIPNIQDDPVTKNCCLSPKQWEIVENFRFQNRFPSMSETVRALTIIGLEHEKALGMYVPE